MGFIKHKSITTNKIFKYLYEYGYEFFRSFPHWNSYGTPSSVVISGHEEDIAFSTGAETTVQLVDGGWGNWIEFGHCSVTCGVGAVRRYRLCDTPPPGEVCEGTSEDQVLCHRESCPVV